MNIRVMTEGDASAAAALDLAYAPQPWTTGMFLEEVRLQAFCRVLWDGALHGFVIARPLYDEWHLLNLMVTPRQRRRGWGARLVTMAMQQAARENGRELLLEVRRSNGPAIRLYKSLGFLEIGRRKGYYRTPLPVEDGVVMRHTLAREGTTP